MSMLYRGDSESDVTLVNHNKKILVNPMEPMDKDERIAVICDIARIDPL